MQGAFFQPRKRGLTAAGAQGRRQGNACAFDCAAVARKLIGLLLILTILVPLAAQGETAEMPDYAQVESWAYLEESTDKPADIFFICPTVYGGGEGIF